MIDKIRRQVLLDMGRDWLAVICGRKNQREWKERKATSTQGDDFAVCIAMMTEMEIILCDSNGSSRIQDSSDYYTYSAQFLIKNYDKS